METEEAKEAKEAKEVKEGCRQENVTAALNAIYAEIWKNSTNFR